MRTLLVLGLCLAAIQPNKAEAQSSSLFGRASANTPGLTVRNTTADGDHVDNETPLRQASYFAPRSLPKRILKVGDLITVIVRQKSEYKHSGKNDVDRQLEAKLELKDWIRFNECKLVPEAFPAGEPKIDFKMDRNFKGNGKKDRTDEVVTRITCKIVDVLPNKTLVLQGGPDVIETDDEKQVVTLTGTCRSEDIAADNTILSTQISELKFTRKSTGSVRDAMRRGWAYRLWDLVRPF